MPRREVHVIVASDHEDPLAKYRSGFAVVEDIEQVATLDVEDDVLESDIPVSLQPHVLRLVPREVLHSCYAGGTETLRFDGFARPVVDLDRFLSATFDVINSGPARRPPVFYMAHLLWRHRKTQTVLIAPRWIQAVLLPTIVLVGTLLGRYRGTDWPGCPDRFPPAPLFT